MFQSSVLVCSGKQKRLYYYIPHIGYVLCLQHSVVFYEQDGDEVYQFRVQADLVRVPDHEILQVRISTYCVGLILMLINYNIFYSYVFE
jgi:hypothetical protein